MTTILDLNPFYKLYPKRNEEPVTGQYYFNCVPMEDGDTKLWKFSISGPTNNGPTIVRFLVANDDPVIIEHGIQAVIARSYEMFRDRWPRVDLVCRSIT